MFLLDLSRGTSTQLTFGARSDGDPSWSPDGKSIACTSSADAILNDQDASYVEVIDVDSRQSRALTGRTMRESNPIFSPDGKHIAYAYTDGDSQIALTQMYATTPSGGPGTAVSAAIDRPIGGAVWSNDSRSLIVTAPDGLTNALYRILLDGEFQRIEVGDVTPGIPLTTTGGANAPNLRNAIASDGTLAFVGYIDRAAAGNLCALG